MSSAHWTALLSARRGPGRNLLDRLRRCLPYFEAFVLLKLAKRRECGMSRRANRAQDRGYPATDVRILIAQGLGQRRHELVATDFQAAQSRSRRPADRSFLVRQR